MTFFKIFIAGLLNYVWNNIVTHIPVHAIRKIFLRSFNRNIARSSAVLLHVRILNFWSVMIGDRVVINQYVLIDCRKYKVVIEHDADIGPYTRIWTLAHDPESDSHAVLGDNVTIGHHAWLASGVTILPGVKIGAGAVAASGAVITKDIPPLEIWSGVPARFLKKRNNKLDYQIDYEPYFE